MYEEEIPGGIDPGSHSEMDRKSNNEVDILTRNSNYFKFEYNSVPVEELDVEESVKFSAEAIDGKRYLNATDIEGDEVTLLTSDDWNRILGLTDLPISFKSNSGFWGQYVYGYVLSEKEVVFDVGVIDHNYKYSVPAFKRGYVGVFNIENGELYFLHTKKKTIQAVDRVERLVLVEELINYRDYGPEAYVYEVVDIDNKKTRQKFVVDYIGLSEKIPSFGPNIYLKAMDLLDLDYEWVENQGQKELRSYYEIRIKDEPWFVNDDEFCYLIMVVYRTNNNNPSTKIYRDVDRLEEVPMKINKDGELFLVNGEAD